MWRYPFMNLCFVIVVITVLALQHSASVFGPMAHGDSLTDSDLSREFGYTSAGESSRGLRAPAGFHRAAGFLRDTWRRGMVIKEWLMEYNTSQWEIFNASNRAESDLLEARFHVANAEVFTEAMSEGDRALKELVRAESALKAAESLIGPHLAQQLESIDVELAAAETSERQSAFNGVPFETIKTELDHAIGSVRAAKT
ncbi:MAG TPA: hypothetical protein VMT22_14530 [Terriglobales bacterium]|jgi:hypothetical protein|nr:hypothetical protein [Terriglobales bacterium]